VVELDDAHAYRRLRPEQPPEEFARRRAAGALCFAAVEGGRVVGATWAQRGGGWCAYLEREVVLRDDEVYLFDTLVDPRRRGARIAPAIALAQIDVLRVRGVVRLVATVLPENRASLRARARSGFRICGRMGWIGVGPLRRHFAVACAARAIAD
jgi:L-amino acid N-acyltransferase YncA